MTGTQRLYATFGLINWPLFFVHNTQVQRMADGCSGNYDLTIIGASGSVFEEECGDDAAACTVLVAANVNGDGRVLVFKAHTWFDTVAFSALTTDNQRMHTFAHEFGHPMSLADHYGSCGSTVMTQNGCDDLVKHGSYPNDLCWPVYLHYYSDWAQYC